MNKYLLQKQQILRQLHFKNQNEYKNKNINKFKIEYQQILINNIFAIGFRCNSDFFFKRFS